MEAAVAAPSLLFSSPTPRRPSSCLPPPCSSSSSSYASHGAKLQQPQLQFVSRLTSRNSNRSGRSILLFLRCSSSGTDSASSSATSERWILEPAGDGDWRHVRIKSTATLTFHRRFWTCTRAKQNSQAVVFMHRHAFGMSSGTSRSSPC